jgi:hypothetical protein
MQDFNSYPPFQPERADDLAEELYPDIFADASPAIEPGPATAAELSRRGVRRNTARTEKRAGRAERSTDRVQAVQNDVAPLSLVDALRTTITRKQPRKEQIVIAGEKRKRQRNTDSVFSVRPARPLSLSPRLRLVILFVVIALILLSILLFPMGLGKM